MWQTWLEANHTMASCPAKSEKTHCSGPPLGGYHRTAAALSTGSNSPLIPKPVANQNRFENYGRLTMLVPAGRWRDADEFRSEFRSARLLESPTAFRVIERAVSSLKQTESDHARAVGVRQAAPVPLCPVSDRVFHRYRCRFGLAVLQRRGQTGDRWLVSTP